MTDLLRHAFGWICGQYPAHTWSPGGELLPLCQRCVGVYTGAFAAAILHLVSKPAPTPRWLWLNGALLLFIIPSGFYWIPQNPELRCASGILFGFGIVSFLQLTLPLNTGPAPGGKPGSHMQIATNAATLLAALVLVPLLAKNGNALAAALLNLASVAGALSLTALMAANVFFFLRWLARRNSTKPA